MDEAERRELTNGYINLKEHFEKLWKERKENITLQFQANSDRLNATATVLEHRLEVLNHAHEQSVEDRAEFVRGSEYRSKMKELDSWCLDMGTRLTQSETRAKTWAFITGFLFTLIQIAIGIMIFIKK